MRAATPPLVPPERRRSLRNVAARFVLGALSLTACDPRDGGAPTGSAASAASTSSPRGATSSAPGGATSKDGDAPSVAFPTQDLPAPFDQLTIDAPAGARLAKGPLGDDVSIACADYTLKIEASKDADVSKVKGLLEKMGARITLDQPSGFIAQTEEKGAPSFQVLQVVKIGEKQHVCSNVIQKAIGTAEKAREAFDVCGSLKSR